MPFEDTYLNHTDAQPSADRPACVVERGLILTLKLSGTKTCIRKPLYATERFSSLFKKISTKDWSSSLAVISVRPFD